MITIRELSNKNKKEEEEERIRISHTVGVQDTHTIHRERYQRSGSMKLLERKIPPSSEFIFSECRGVEESLNLSSISLKLFFSVRFVEEYSGFCLIRRQRRSAENHYHSEHSMNIFQIHQIIWKLYGFHSVWLWGIFFRPHVSLSGL